MHKSALYPIRPERSEYSSTNGICDVERQWNMLGACDKVDGSREVAFGRGLGMMEGSHFCYVF